MTVEDKRPFLVIACSKGFQPQSVRTDEPNLTICHRKGEQSAAATICQRHKESSDREVSQQEHTQPQGMKPQHTATVQPAPAGSKLLGTGTFLAQLAWAQPPHPLKVTQQEGISLQPS